ncbi:MAG: oxidoreductase [Kiritimatiellia bacterium]
MGIKLSEQERKDILAAIHSDLLVIAKESFPKQCACGKRYENLEDFIARTEEVRDGRGLFLDEDYARGEIVDMVRNCSCGSTLMVAFESRRDLSAEGDARRAIFGRLQTFFSLCGMDAETARSELLKTGRGEPSPALQKAFAECDMSRLEREFIHLQIRALRVMMKK